MPIDEIDDFESEEEIKDHLKEQFSKVLDELEVEDLYSLTLDVLNRDGVHTEYALYVRSLETMLDEGLSGITEILAYIFAEAKVNADSIAEYAAAKERNELSDEFTYRVAIHDMRQLYENWYDLLQDSMENLRTEQIPDTLLKFLLVTIIFNECYQVLEEEGIDFTTRIGDMIKLIIFKAPDENVKEELVSRLYNLYISPDTDNFSAQVYAYVLEDFSSEEDFREIIFDRAKKLYESHKLIDTTEDILLKEKLIQMEGTGQPSEVVLNTWYNYVFAD